MKDYWLAKLIGSVGEVDSRKRLQKSIYLLQQRTGCPLRLSYILHYYGPYSFELAGLIDQLKGADIIDETADVLSPSVVRYKSKISKKGRRVLVNFQKSKTGTEVYGQIKPFISYFQDLNGEDLWPLELAATVAYFYEGSWPKAKTQTAKFKHLEEKDRTLKEATAIAGRFVTTR